MIDTRLFGIRATGAGTNRLCNKKEGILWLTGLSAVL